MRITLSHPHGSLNSYHAASALADKGWLDSFQTGITSDTAIARLSSRLFSDYKERFLNRRFVDIPRERQHSFFCWEAVSRIGRRFKPKGITSQTNWYDFLFCGHDWQASRKLKKTVDAVYTYEDGARLTFEVAKRHSIAKVYELPAGYFLGAANELKRTVKYSPNARADIKQEPDWKRARKDSELELADLVVIASEWSRESLNFSKAKNKHVIKVPYGTSSDEVTVRDKRPEGAFTVLFAGLIGVRKGVPLLLEAWDRLALNDARLWLAGSVSLDQRYLKGHTGLSHLGALPRIRLLEVMREVDLFVFPSLAEGFGMVIGEAMAAGVPVLTTMNTGGPELITDGREGWCVPAHDVDSLAERMEWAYKHRDALYEMGIAARRRAEQWTWADYRRKLIEELSKHLNTPLF